MSPQPPAPAAQSALGVHTVMTGESIQAADGTHIIATDDLVLIVPYLNGEPTEYSYSFTVEQAMHLAATISSAAGKLVNAEVDDHGKPTSLVHRLRRLNGARS